MRTIAVLVDFTGGVRSRSSSETRLPSGTASAGASAGSARCAARASTDTPGSSTRFLPTV
ncbi:hypothetical protein [Streptomyces gibsoniae]|uniref:Uncharacterized protein n=1 Tax=Streptomyces gibsoniae TaxID=3075529 RepID=A0ABU2U970_9ACTN|nr:hypothetical protein [Streptomyces sp. DSM 41699]MDT0469789.1 hypothetical protein [Streptomyces sp. DSM 41699]